MRNILIPVDFTPRSRAALNYAAMLFQKPETKFILLHSFSTFYASEFLISVDDIIEHDIQKKLLIEKEFLQKILGNNGAEIITICEKDNIISSLSKFSIKYNADLVILGSSNEDSWSDVTYKEEGKTMNIVKSLSLTCLIVPELGKIKMPKNILFATMINGINESKEIQPILDLVTNCEAHLDIIHIGNEKTLTSKIEGGLKRTTNGYFDGIDYNLHAILEADVYSAIKSFAQEHSSEIICLMYRKHNSIERLIKPSISKKIITNLDRPILALKHQ